eukprot:TRINITY_DN14774_c0_g1_i2.p1 TRINITY_DN14774_c0_g1~~TRINITY_DN14774_c0_g1_i2.p1  ORF type:complete len:342 (+),score=53.25 TRINITY_DN14774_c0_g1_i2:58-1026(+)
MPFLGLPDYTVMVVTAWVTVAIIGGGFAVLPGILFKGENAWAMWAISLGITAEVAVGYWRGMTTTSFVAEEDPVHGCAKCGSVKNEGTHHCSICKRCVRGMDHHCLFLNSCVGDTNQAAFIKYVTWVSSSCLYVFVLSVCALHDTGVPMIDMDPRKTAAFALAFPTALVPACVPVLGFRRAVVLTVSLVMHLSVGAVCFVGKLPLLAYPLSLFLACYVSKDQLVHFIGTSIGAPLAVVFTTVFLFTTSSVRPVLALCAASLFVTCLTGFLLVSHIVRLYQGVTTLEELKGIAKPSGRLDGYANIKKAMEAASWRDIVVKLIL